jgi:tetratricopeptide (TPR) repeat protein
MKRIVQTLGIMMILVLLSMGSSYGALNDKPSMDGLRESRIDQSPTKMAMSLFNRVNGKHQDINDKGIKQFKEKQFEKAVVSFTNVLEMTPEYADGYNNRGMSHYQLKSYEKAIQDFNKAISLNLEFAEAYNNRGMAFKKKGLLEEAKKDREKAIQLNPSLSNVVF